MSAQTSDIHRNVLHKFAEPSMKPPCGAPTWRPENSVNVTVKGKTDTNGYPFEQVNRSLSVRPPKKIRSKRSTNRSNGLHIRSKYISIRSKYCDIRSNGFFICSPTRSVRSENCGIRSNGLTPVLFIRSKGENCTRRFSAVIQCSSLNVATTSM